NGGRTMDRRKFLRRVGRAGQLSAVRKPRRRGGRRALEPGRARRLPGVGRRQSGLRPHRGGVPGRGGAGGCPRRRGSEGAAAGLARLLVLRRIADDTALQRGRRLDAGDGAGRGRRGGYRPVRRPLSDERPAGGGRQSPLHPELAINWELCATSYAAPTAKLRMVAFSTAGQSTRMPSPGPSGAWTLPSPSGRTTSSEPY